MRKKKLFLMVLIAFAILVVESGLSWASITEDSWIFRSEVAPGQSMWGKLPAWKGDFTWDDWSVKTGMFKGTGLTASGIINLGEISGNLEGNISAKYNRVIKPGPTPIALNWSGIDNESLISTGLGAKIDGNLGVKIDMPWPVPDINFGGSASASPYVQNDLNYKANLGNTFSNSDQTNLLSIGADIVVASAKMDINAELDSFFTPKEISGHIRAWHLESGNSLPDIDIPVKFDSTTLELTEDVDLTPGHWEISLEDFLLETNEYYADLSLELELILAGAVVGDVFKFESDCNFDFIPDVTSQLDFLHHGYDGDDRTVDRLGRFYIHVVPIPGAVWILGSGLVGLIGLRRKFNR